MHTYAHGNSLRRVTGLFQTTLYVIYPNADRLYVAQHKKQVDSNSFDNVKKTSTYFYVPTRNHLRKFPGRHEQPYAWSFRHNTCNTAERLQIQRYLAGRIADLITQVTNPASYLLDTIDPAGGPYLYKDGNVSTTELAYHREQLLTNMSCRQWTFNWLGGQVHRHEREKLMNGTYGHRAFLQGPLQHTHITTRKNLENVSEYCCTNEAHPQILRQQCERHTWGGTDN